MINDSLYNFAIIGAGIIGLSTALNIIKQFPGSKVVIFDKEKDFAFHQTGHNSGVIHSGIYYKPGSFKAKFAKAGNESMVNFCREYDIKHEICGKVIVATHKKELTLLDNLYQRGIRNGLGIKKIDKKELSEIEPYVDGIAGIKVPSAGIVNYKEVAKTFATLISQKGGEIFLKTKITKIYPTNFGVHLETNRGTFKAKFLINCAGLYSDRVTKMAKAETNVKIVPFRGEYYNLKSEKNYLVKSLIYPVPNPDFPFLGVHLTKMINGDIHAGPNAVLGFKREAYNKLDINLKDLFEVLTYPGFLKLASKNVSEGSKEILRSISKTIFLKSLQRLVPDINKEDIIPTHAGVRAQALLPNGNMVDDFMLVHGKNSVNVCNAPSPAATASIEIGKYIANYLTQVNELVRK